MKKLDESVLRRLILETIDEQAGVLVEGKKKKKLKEVEPAGTPAPETDKVNSREETDANYNDHWGEADPPDATYTEYEGDNVQRGGLNIPNQLNLSNEEISNALSSLNDKNPVTRVGAWSILTNVAEWITSKDKEIKKASEGKQTAG